MKTVLHLADSRGHVDFGWLQSYHTFSFGSYHNPERIHFGALRVLNDDTVAPGRGFATHAHQNMEIISIPLEGDLEHKDSLGNQTLIHQGDVQVMSAGTGVRHSEYNKNRDRPVKFLQIWLIPNQQNVAPRYGQITLKASAMHNRLAQILSPKPDDDGVWVHQRAWFHLGNLDAGLRLPYTWKSPQNGLYLFVIRGRVQVGEQVLEQRDGMGIWETEQIDITAQTAAYILLMEVPMG
ncbi:MAG: pirin family protein [Bernardetiaceae bacterium]